MRDYAPYRIDGRSFSREELLAHCHMMVHDYAHADWSRKLFAFIAQFLNPSSGPLLQRSSGTTGDPKTFEMEREAMEASARKTLAFFNLKPGARVLLTLPVDYIAGKMMVVRALAGKLDLCLTEPSSRPLEHTTGLFDFTSMVPLQLVETIRAGDDLGRIKTVLIGGGALPPSLHARLIKMDVPALYESFGMTETYTHFGLRRINGPAPERSFSLLEGAAIRTDARGCLVVELPGVTNGPVVTNDLVEIFEGGNRFSWLGRFDNLINTGGIKVIPELLEQLVSSHLQLPSLLLPLPDEKLGQKMLLMVEYPDPDPPVEKWRSLLQKHLASHEIPKQFFPVTEIPRNASFKPDRKAALKLLIS